MVSVTIPEIHQLNDKLCNRAMLKMIRNKNGAKTLPEIAMLGVGGARKRTKTRCA